MNDYPNETTRTKTLELIQKIESLPNNDDLQLVKELISILNNMLRIKEFTPPTIEVMTILKHKKPILYHGTKQRLTTSSNLTILFQLETDLGLVRERLEEIVNKQ